jgi:hypothetical protein
MEFTQPKPLPPPGVPLVINADRFCGAVVDRYGRETPITDEMVIKACNALAYVRYPFRERFPD